MPRIRKANKATSAKKWTIGIYIRLSREDRDKDDTRCFKKGSRRNKSLNVDDNASGSIVEQDKIMTEWVEDYFQEEDYSIIDYFVDDGLTGTDDTRDDFRRLMKEVELGRINCIVVKTLSRAFRNYADQGRYLEEVFPRLGVRFIASGNPFVDSYHDPDAVSSGMEIPINGIMNDRYAAKTSADIRRTFDAKRRRGEFIGPFAPYGYNKDPENRNKLIIDEEAAHIVKSIFLWYVNEGMSKLAIAKRLNELEVPNPTTYKTEVQHLNYHNPQKHHRFWCDTNIFNILTNQVYIGNMVQGRHRVISYKVHTQISVPEDEWYVVPDTHDAIVDKETFAKAQLLHSRDTRTAPRKRHVYLFSGFIRCADCKKNMRRKTSKNFVYYTCRTKSDTGMCSKHAIREDILTSAVLDAIRIQIKLVESLSNILDVINQQHIVNTQSARLNGMLKRRKDELDKINDASDALYFDWKSGEITKEEYRRMKNRFDEKAKKLNEAIQTIHCEINSMADGINSDDAYLTAFLNHKDIQTLERGIVVELIDTIDVHEDGKLTINFAFADEVKRVIDFIDSNPIKLLPTKQLVIS